MTKLVVPSQRFGAALHNAALFASKDKVRPILCAALVTWTPEQVEVVATDSYGLLVQRFDRTDGDDAGQVQADRDQLAAFSKLALADKLNGPARLTVEDADLTFEVGHTTAGGKALTYGDFPNFRMLIPGELYDVPLPIEQSEVGCSWCWPLEWLSRLGKLKPLDGRKNVSITLQSGVTPLKPAAFEVRSGEQGSRVFGLVMPVRV